MSPDVRELLECIGVPAFRYREVKAWERWAAAAARPLALPEADLAPAAPAARRVRQAGFTVALVSLVEGVGRTTLAANLANALLRGGCRCAAVDLDPKGELELHFVAQRATPGSRAPQVVKELDAVAARSGVLIVDTPAHPGRALERALAAADEVVVVLRPDRPCYDAVRPIEALLVRGMAGPEPRRRSRYLVNRFDGRRRLDREIASALRGLLGERVFPFQVQSDPIVPQALAARRCIDHEAPDSQVVADVDALAEWVRAAGERLAAETREGAR